MKRRGDTKELKKGGRVPLRLKTYFTRSKCDLSIWNNNHRRSSLEKCEKLKRM